MSLVMQYGALTGRCFHAGQAPRNLSGRCDGPSNYGGLFVSPYLPGGTGRGLGGRPFTTTSGKRYGTKTRKATRMGTSGSIGGGAFRAVHRLCLVAPPSVGQKCRIPADTDYAPPCPGWNVMMRSGELFPELDPQARRKVAPDADPPAISGGRSPTLSRPD